MPPTQNVILKPVDWRDIDGDGKANKYDDDDDNDGVPDNNDIFRANPTEWIDQDNDGIGDNEDKDADGDDYVYFSDCDDQNPNAWVSCVSCIDGDTDDHFIGCDAYFSVGEDCDDDYPWLWDSCSVSFDEDGDGHKSFYDSAERSPDCDDENPYLYPGAFEYCDGISNQCSNNEIDTGCELDIVGTFIHEDPMRDIHKIGNYLYFLGPNLKVMDVSDPTSPVIAGQDIDGGPQTAFDLHETEDGKLLAYMVHSYSNSLTIIDVTDPASMNILGGDTVVQAFDIIVDSFTPVGGSTLYTTAYIIRPLGFFEIWDVSNPSSTMKEGETIVVQGGFPTEVNSFVGIWERNLIMLGYDGDVVPIFRTYDISSPQSPSPIGENITGFFDLYDTFISGDYLYGSGFCPLDGETSNGFYIGYYLDFQFKFPWPIELNGETCVPLEPQADPSGIYEQDGFVYVAANEGGLQIFDARDHSNVLQILAFDTAPFKANKILVSGDYAYLTVDQERRLYVLDVSEFQ